MQESEQNLVPVVRHLEDENNLKKSGRNGELLPGQEGAARKYAIEILKSVEKDDKKAVLLLCSSLKRARQTGQLIANEIKVLNPNIRTVTSVRDDLSNMYEGVPNIPEDYVEGGDFKGFSIGKQIFAKEVFCENPNLLYKFGDPVKTESGYKYPELLGYFEEFGENFRDFLLRMMNLFLEVSENLNRLDKKTKIVAVTHSQQYQMFYDLRSIAQDVLDNNMIVTPGEISKICWKRYSDRLIREGKPIYGVRHIDVDCLEDENVIELIKKEADYLSKLN